MQNRTVIFTLLSVGLVSVSLATALWGGTADAQMSAQMTNQAGSEANRLPGPAFSPMGASGANGANGLNPPNGPQDQTDPAESKGGPSAAGARPDLGRGPGIGPGPSMGRPFPPPPGHAAPAAPFVYGLAQQLSVAQIYVGISAAQEEAWRAYTNAVIAFFEADLPAGNDPQALQHDDVPPPGADEPLQAERLAEHAIRIAEKAQTLQSASKALRAALTPEQLKRLKSMDVMTTPDDAGFDRPPFFAPSPFPGDARD